MVADTLLLDCGNSACKYRYNRLGGRLVTLDAVLAFIERYRPARILVATVSRLGHELCQRLEEQGIAYSRLRVRDDWRGLRLAYRQPQALGIDRWLTLVAIRGRGQPAVVIDAGTALTIDAVDAHDRHLGGYILPGLSLMRRALVDDTFALPPVDVAGRCEPGDNTADGIANGSVLALVGAVERALVQFALPRPRVFWTGGDAPAIRLLTREPGTLDPELVFAGMTRLFEDKDYMESLE